MTAAFEEFSNKVLNREKEKDKPSVRETMKDFREKIAHAAKDITKHKHRGGPEL
jgi:predicted DNA-binding helix-hairpin-helix protein